MVVYWDMAAVFDLLTDYLLLLASAHLSGYPVSRRRLLAAASVGAAYAVLQLMLPRSAWLALAVLAAMGALAYAGTGRAVKLTLLFLLLGCGFAGAVVLLGQLFGSLAPLARGIFCAELPWGVFLIASAASYLLMKTVFRGSVRQAERPLARATVTYRGSRVRVRLLRDSGNLLTDGEGRGVVILGCSAARTLLRGAAAEETIAYRAVGTENGTLPAFRCDALEIDGTAYGARLVAVAPQNFDGGYAGLWCGEAPEKGRGRHEDTLQ